MIYVCIRCRFHYGPVAQVRSFQEQRGDLIKLSLITGHTGSERESRERKGDRGGIFTIWTHTPHTQGEYIAICFQDHGGSQTGVHLKDEWE